MLRQNLKKLSRLRCLGFSVVTEEKAARRRRSVRLVVFLVREKRFGGESAMRSFSAAEFSTRFLYCKWEIN